MAKRDMMAIYEQEQHNVPDGYDMTISEIRKLVYMGRDGEEVEAVNIAFVYGFALGRRAEKNHAQKKDPRR